MPRAWPLLLALGAAASAPSGCGGGTLVGSSSARRPAPSKTCLLLQSWVQRSPKKPEIDLPAPADVKYDPAQLSFLIPEARAMASLPVVALQLSRHFPELKIQILYAASNEEFVHHQATLRRLRKNGTVVLTRMPERFFDAKEMSGGGRHGRQPQEMYSAMLESPDFWEATLTPKVLLAQTDTWLCNGARKHLREFLQYDYVGAPWGHLVHECPLSKVGNGGFSLRDRDAMLRITRAREPDGLPEDVYFCAHADGMKIAPPEVAEHFAREERIPGDPWPWVPKPAKIKNPLVGVHKLVIPDYGFSAEEVQSRFEHHCPGVSLMVSVKDEVDTSPGWKRSEELVKKWEAEGISKPALQLALEQMVDAVSLANVSSLMASG